MNSIQLLCLVYLITLPISNSLQKKISLTSEPGAMASEILDFCEEKIEDFRFSNQKDLHFVFADGEKTIVSLFLVKSEIDSVKNSSGQYSYIDRYNLVNKYSTSLIPELVTEKACDLNYYIFPNWGIDRYVQEEILISYFVKRLSNFANSVKIILVSDFDKFKDPTLVNTTGALSDLITNAITWIKDVDKIRPAISLVITNVTKTYEDDWKVRENANIALETLAQGYINETINSSTPIDVDEKIQIKLNFINGIIDKGLHPYSRISILRKANETGSVYKFPWLETERKTISNSIKYNTQYTKIESGDLEYPLSEASKLWIPNLIKQLGVRVRDTLSDIFYDIKQFYYQKEKQYSDLNDLYDAMNKGLETISEVYTAELNLFVSQLISMVESLQIDLRLNNFKVLVQRIDLYKHLRSLNNTCEDSIDSICSKELRGTEKYFRESKEWYSFLIQLYESLSEYNVQKNISQYRSDAAELIAQFSIEEYEEKNVDSTNLKQFLDRIGSNMYETIKNFTINAYKSNAIIKVLNQTTNAVVTSICINGELIIEGEYVHISKVNKLKCPRKITSIVIHSQRMYIDGDVDKTGEAITFFVHSYYWQVLGQRKFILSGADGNSQSSAPDGIETGENGSNGKPGLPGGYAGAFVGYGKIFKNAENLSIYANGGRGGPGQNGGKGFLHFDLILTYKHS